MTSANGWQVTFFVPGVPVQQGSKNHVGNGVMIDSAKGLKPWRADVKVYAQSALQKAGLTCIPAKTPVSVSVMFVFKRLSATPKRETGRTEMVVYPDIDKLLRSILDALTGAVFPDDGQVTHTVAAKCRAAPEEPLGAHITITRLGGES